VFVKKIAKSVAQPIFVKNNMYITFTRGKKNHKMWAASVILKNLPQRKQLGEKSPSQVTRGASDPAAQPGANLETDEFATTAPG
jgi:hypothetical protein